MKEGAYILNLLILVVITFSCSSNRGGNENSDSNGSYFKDSSIIKDNTKYVLITDTLFNSNDTAIIDTTLALNDTNYFFFVSLAQKSLSRGNYDLYKKCLQSLEEITPWDPHNMIGLGGLYERDGEKNKAMKFYRKALRAADSLILDCEKRGDISTGQFYAMVYARGAKLTLPTDSSDVILTNLIEKYPNSIVTDDLKTIKNGSRERLLIDYADFK